MNKNSKDIGGRWLTVDSICEYLTVSDETLCKWIEQRATSGHRVGRRWMFNGDEVDEWSRFDAAADKHDKADIQK